MRRAALAAVSTVVGLVLLLSFKSHGGRPGRLAALGAPTPITTAPPAPRHQVAAPTRSSAAAPVRPITRTVSGQAIDTQYGPVQVQVTFVGSRIVRITPVQLPSGQSRDDQINSYAVPILTQEALTAQSAHIDTVSGASFTSDGYAQSLQSALDQAAS
ncbi:MAG: FMN-binding protein [Mycobacteriales bacterium]